MEFREDLKIVEVISVKPSEKQSVIKVLTTKHSVEDLNEQDYDKVVFKFIIHLIFPLVYGLDKIENQIFICVFNLKLWN